jgi:hypothetical protein
VIKMQSHPPWHYSHVSLVDLVRVDAVTREDLQGWVYGLDALSARVAGRFGGWSRADRRGLI